MKLIRTEDAVGQVLCHDITQIIPGVVKDAVFRKGHIVTKEDIPVLLSVGKEHLYVWEKKEGILHEDEAAVILRDLCINDNMTASEPKEGKIEIRRSRRIAQDQFRKITCGERTGRDDDRHHSRQFSGESRRQAGSHAHYPTGDRRGKNEPGKGSSRWGTAS